MVGGERGDEFTDVSSKFQNFIFHEIVCYWSGCVCRDIDLWDVFDGILRWVFFEIFILSECIDKPFVGLKDVLSGSWRLETEF